MNPATVAEYAESAGYSIPDSGSSWTLISEGCEHYGVHATEVPMDEDRIKSKLDEAARSSSMWVPETLRIPVIL